MELLADALLLLGALAAALYCWVLSKRVKGLNSMDSGLGTAIASLSTQVNEMQSTLKAARSETGSSAAELSELVERAEKATENLKLMLATVQEDTRPRKVPASRARKSQPKRKTQSSVPEEASDEPERPGAKSSKLALSELLASELPEEAYETVRKAIETNTELAAEEDDSNAETADHAPLAEAPLEIRKSAKNDTTKTAKLKENVTEKLKQRNDERTRDELVEALQTILAANR